MLKLKHFLILLSLSVVLLSVMYIPTMFNAKSSEFDMKQSMKMDSVAVSDCTKVSYHVMDDSTVPNPAPPMLTKGIEDEGNMVGATKKSEEFVSSPVEKSTEPFDYKEFITWILGAMNGFFGMILLVKKVFFKEK